MNAFKVTRWVVAGYEWHCSFWELTLEFCLKAFWSQSAVLTWIPEFKKSEIIKGISCNRLNSTGYKHQYQVL